jgi:Rieske Fe-S protein
LATYRHPAANPSDGETANIPCWVRNVDGEKFQVFAINCAHLGCPVRWFPQSGLFMCPCHGGVYYSDGSRASGPPERGLFEYAYKVEQDKLLIKAGEMPTTGAPTAGLINISLGRPPCV